MRRLTYSILLLFLSFFALSQSNAPVWDIGAKWTYEFSPLGRSHTSMTNEIIDTTTINGFKLYVVESSPKNSGIRYFYFENDLVFNYNERTDRMTLLYNFTEKSQYEIEDCLSVIRHFPMTACPLKTTMCI